MPIQILKEELINQIAAGEVVERPAHLVKELVENAIDAGARQITVDYSQGGRYVKVKDDGSGMGREDLELSVQRHATSKITDSADLWNINSFGFRGEALASISSVCNFEIQSGTGESAHRLKIEFGQAPKIVDTGAMKGTQIVVDDLFGNVPARLKFLKSNAAEHTQIKNVLKSLALANEAVSFKIRQDEKLIANWTEAKDFKQRVAQILEVSSDQVYVYHSEDSNGFRSEVALLPPNQVARNLRQLTSLVRGRAVNDRTLQQAVIEAFRGALMHGEYPIGVIRLDCPAAEVDVNVHPTKSQVKFRNSQSAFRVIYRAARQFVEEAPWIEKVSKQTESAVISAPSLFDARPEPKQSSMQFQFAKPMSRPNEITNSQSYRSALEAANSLTRPLVNESPEGPKNLGWSNLRILSQAHQTYLVCQAEEAVVFVDQHAAHERVLFERLMRSWKQSEALEVQQLLIPLTVDLNEELVEALQTQTEHFQKLGIDMEVAGPQTVAINSHPSILKDSAIIKLMPEVADEVLRQGESFSFAHALDDIFATMACHSAVRAGQNLTMEQMQKLLEQMDEFRESSFCPHGRPVFVEFKLPEIERRFGRIN